MKNNNITSRSLKKSSRIIASEFVILLIISSVRDLVNEIRLDKPTFCEVKKIRRYLSNHNVKTVLKPCNTIGKKLPSDKDLVDLITLQAAIPRIANSLPWLWLLVHWRNKTQFFHPQKRILIRHFGIYDSISQHSLSIFLTTNIHGLYQR